jgi:hypothetical protein
MSAIQMLTFSKFPVAGERLVIPAVSQHSGRGETIMRPLKKKIRVRHLGDFNYNFNDLKTASVELPPPIHAGLSPALHFRFHLNLCYSTRIIFSFERY